MLASKRHRPGTVQVLFGMLMFGIFGLAAAVIDVGSARHAQRAMQSAADAAALEAARYQSAAVPADVDPDDATPDFRTVARRVAADAFADATRENGSVIVNGAGPVYGLSGGVGDGELAGGQLLTVDPQNRTYKPTLQLNRDGNAAHGDIVRGAYNFAATDPPVEAADYTRTDFDPAATTPNAVLVRLRRTGEGAATASLDHIDGVSQAGPAVPYLFGRGSLMHRKNGAAANPRADGVTVRATAVAAAVPAKAVGVLDAAAGLEGLAPLALTRAYWSSLPAGTTSVSFDVNAGGVLTAAGKSTVVGRVIDRTQLAGLGRRVGQATDPAAPALAAAELPFAVYVPLYDSFPNSGDRVVGFALAPVTAASAASITVAPAAGGTLAGKPPRNLSGAVRQGPGTDLTDATLAAADLDTVFATNAGLAAATPAVVALAVVPVLVR